MNLENIGKRDILDFDSFRKKVHDENYKPLSPANQSEGGLSKSGIHSIKREPAYDHVGYADAIFGDTSRINVPGIRVNIAPGDETPGTYSDATGFGSTHMMHASESENTTFITKLSDFV